MADRDVVAAAKSALRERMLRARSELDPRLQAKWGQAITNRLVEREEFGQADTLHLYIDALSGEVPTHELATRALTEGKRVAVPKIATFKPPEMVALEISSLDELALSSTGLWEPDPSRADRVPEDEIDLVVVPGVAFDRTGHRIGLGGGFYDRWLAAVSALKVALAFSLQVVERVPHTGRDQRVDWIVTENDVIDCRELR
jgi:5-formyltetrahydrofolate cyclo-ligase